MTTELVLENLALAVALVCITVFIQVALTFFVLRQFRGFDRFSNHGRVTFVRMLALAIMVLTILVGHLIQINVWAVAFYLFGFFDGYWSAQYFAAETYTTLGYGDLLLPPERRMLAGWLAIHGLLMVGWSTALFAYLITRYHDAHRTMPDRRVGDRHP